MAGSPVFNKRRVFGFKQFKFVLATQMSKQLRPISFLGPFFAVTAINKGFLRLLIMLSKTMGRKRSDFDCLPHCKANIKLTPVTWSFNLRKTSCFTWSRKSSLCLKSGPKWGPLGAIWLLVFYKSDGESLENSGSLEGARSWFSLRSITATLAIIYLDVTSVEKFFIAWGRDKYASFLFWF